MPSLEQKRELARQMRLNPTPAEAALWKRLSGKQMGAKFLRQHVMLGYIADFCCADKSLVVEVDGSSHDGRQAEDAKRDEAMRRHGWYVLRFTNDEVLDHIEGVLGRIAGYMADPMGHRKGMAEAIRSLQAPRRRRPNIDLLAEMMARAIESEHGRVGDDCDMCIAVDNYREFHPARGKAAWAA